MVIEVNRPRFDNNIMGISLPEPLFRGGIVTDFIGRNGDLYTVETYKSGSENSFVKKVGVGYIEAPGYDGLVATLIGLYEVVYPERTRRNPVLTLERMIRTLSHPRTILEIIRHEGVMPVGYGIFPKLDVQGEPVFYSSRAIVLAHEGQGAGTYTLERAIELHRKESARVNKPLNNGMFMTQNCYSIKSLENLRDKGVIERIQSLDEPYDPEGKHILFGIHSQVRLASQAIEDTGVSRGELQEVGRNEAALVPEEGTRAREIYDKMVLHPPTGLGMNLPAGDVWYLRFSFPSSIVAAAA